MKELVMGCDYYIIKQLKVQYLDDGDENNYVTIELERQNRYFNDANMSDNSDDDDDNEYNYDETPSQKFDRLYKKYLNVTYKPRILFNEGRWLDKQSKYKYDGNIMDEINNGLIISVIKQEVRCLS